jgi:hypothetical protein
VREKVSRRDEFREAWRGYGVEEDDKSFGGESQDLTSPPTPLLFGRTPNRRGDALIRFSE